MQKHVLLGVIARSTLVKLLAHLEIMTAVQRGCGGGSGGSGGSGGVRGGTGADGLATASSGCSGIGFSPFGSIPEVRPALIAINSHTAGTAWPQRITADAGIDACIALLTAVHMPGYAQRICAFLAVYDLCHAGMLHL